MKTSLAEITQHRHLHEQRLIPARLQAGLSLTERLRDVPSLDLESHLVHGSSAIHSHANYGERVHERLGLRRIDAFYGRHSGRLREWGQLMLDAIAARGFAGAAPPARNILIDEAQDELAKALKIVEEQPLMVILGKQTAESLIHDLLVVAAEKGVLREVAWCLVGAKLTLRFGASSLGGRSCDDSGVVDANDVLSDLKIHSAVIKVAVDPVNTKGLRRIAETLKKSGTEVWLLTRSDRVNGWRSEVDDADDIDGKRVVVTSVEAFVGQNITELAEFSISGKTTQLSALFEIYNSQWIAKVGTPGMRIVLK